MKKLGAFVFLFTINLALFATTRPLQADEHPVPKVSFKFLPLQVRMFHFPNGIDRYDLRIAADDDTHASDRLGFALSDSVQVFTARYQNRPVILGYGLLQSLMTFSDDTNPIRALTPDQKKADQQDLSHFFKNGIVIDIFKIPSDFKKITVHDAFASVINYDAVGLRDAYLDDAPLEGKNRAIAYTDLLNLFRPGAAMISHDGPDQMVDNLQFEHEDLAEPSDQPYLPLREVVALFGSPEGSHTSIQNSNLNFFKKAFKGVEMEAPILEASKLKDDRADPSPTPSQSSDSDKKASPILKEILDNVRDSMNVIGNLPQ